MVGRVLVRDQLLQEQKAQHMRDGLFAHGYDGQTIFLPTTGSLDFEQGVKNESWLVKDSQK